MGNGKKGVLEKNIFKAGVFVLVAHLLFKLAGLIQAKVMGHYLTQETFDVVYAVAFENCIYMLFLLGEESLGPSFLPVFMREMDTESEESAWTFANTVLTIQLILLVAVSAVLMLCPHWVVSCLTTWSASHSPEKFELAAQSVRTLAPAVIGLSLGTTTYVLLNGYKRFFLAAFGDAVWKFCVVAFLVAGAFLSKNSAAMLMWGLVAGALCKVATHLFGLRDKLPRFRFTLDFRHPAFKRLCWLMLPLFVGIIVAKIRDIFNGSYILSALDESGLMQANSMGRKFQSTFLFLVPHTLAIAVFPFFCELVDQNDQRKLGELLTRFGRMLMALFIPLSLFVAVVSVPLTSVLFKGGHFDATAVQRTSISLSLYTAVLPAAAIEALLMRAFFANRRMVSVTLMGIIFSGLSVAISWLGLHYFGKYDLLLLGIIAGGFTLTRYFKSLALIGLLRKNTPIFPFAATLLFLLRMAVVSALAGGIGWWSGKAAEKWLFPTLKLTGLKGDLATILVVGAVFSVVFLAGAVLFRIGEIRDFFDVITAKLKKRNV